MGKKKKSQKTAIKARNEERKEQIKLQKSALGKIVENIQAESTESLKKMPKIN